MNMNYAKQDKIVELSDKYMKMVSQDHHKDRDCHWYIHTVFSYGEAPVFEVEHNGYVYHDQEFNKKFNDYDDAQDFLIEHLEYAIGEQVEWATRCLENVENWDEYQIKHAKSIIEISKL
jgi:hypothetical protein